MKHLSKLLNYIFAVFIVAGMTNLLISSFREYFPYPNLLEATFGIRAYRYLFVDQKILSSIRNSYIIGAASSLLACLMGYFIALRLKEKREHRTVLSLVVFLPLVISSTSVGAGLQILFTKLGLAGTFVGVIAVHTVYILPYSVWILLPGLNSIDPNLIHAANMLGASDRQTFQTITYPLIKHFLRTAVIMGFILSFSQYYLTLVVGIGRINTYTTLSFPFMVEKDRAMSAFMSILFILMNLLFIAVVQLFSKIGGGNKYVSHGRS